MQASDVYARKGTQPGKLHISENTERIQQTAGKTVHLQISKSQRHSSSCQVIGSKKSMKKNLLVSKITFNPGSFGSLIGTDGILIKIFLTCKDSSLPEVHHFLGLEMHCKKMG